MRVRVENLTGVALDWAVTKCELPEGWKDSEIVLGDNTDYSTDWALGGPIIERELIHIWPYDCGPDWKAEVGWYGETFYGEGPTPLTAAMRCFVASRFGDEVDVPEELK